MAESDQSPPDSQYSHSPSLIRIGMGKIIGEGGLGPPGVGGGSINDVTMTACCDTSRHTHYHGNEISVFMSDVVKVDTTWTHSSSHFSGNIPHIFLGI